MDSETIDIKNKIIANTIKNTEYFDDTKKLDDFKLKLESVSKNHQSAIDELKSRISKLDAKKLKIENYIDELSLILEKSTKAAAQYEAKLRVVKNIMHEDYSIAKLKEDGIKLGIEGLAYEIISWDKKYERAMLAVSSDWIKSIVVKDFATLLSLAEVARSKKLPKLKIIPIDAIPNFKLTKPKDSGAIAVLSDFVKCNSKHNGLKIFLFGNVILADSRVSAYRLSKKGYKTVTIDGKFSTRYVLNYI